MTRLVAFQRLRSLGGKDAYRKKLSYGATIFDLDRKPPAASIALAPDVKLTPS
jgi:hypothetical protein